MRVGNKVEANWEGGGVWYAGVVERAAHCEREGAVAAGAAATHFAIRFDDGDFEEDVPAYFVARAPAGMVSAAQGGRAPAPPPPRRAAPAAAAATATAGTAKPPTARPSLFEVGTVRSADDGSRWRVATADDSNKVVWEFIESRAAGAAGAAAPPRKPTSAPAAVAAPEKPPTAAPKRKLADATKAPAPKLAKTAAASKPHSSHIWSAPTGREAIRSRSAPSQLWYAAS